MELRPIELSLWTTVFMDALSAFSRGAKESKDPHQEAAWSADAAVVQFRKRTNSTGRWVMLAATTPSGKTLFMCSVCGRISPTPDKRCPSMLVATDGTSITCADVERGVERPVGPLVVRRVMVTFNREDK